MFYGRRSQMADLMALWRKRVSSFITDNQAQLANFANLLGV